MSDFSAASTGIDRARTENVAASVPTAKILPSLIDTVFANGRASFILTMSSLTDTWSATCGGAACEFDLHKYNLKCKLLDE